MTTTAIAHPRAVPPDPSPLTDFDLVRQSATGDERAFNELYNRHRKKVLRTCHRLLQNEEDVEEASQQTWLSVHLGAIKFRAEAKFSTWLIRIAVNSCLMIRRRKHTKSRRYTTVSINCSISQEDGSFIESAFLASDAWTPSIDQIIKKDRLAKLLKVIECIPHPHREAFVLRSIYEYSVTETAQMLGVSVPCVKSREIRAKLFLRTALGSCD